MKSKIYFMNNGSINIDAMLTFGVSVKDNDNAIGFFGTGMKYAIAIILRNGGSVKVTTLNDGEAETYVFTTETRTIKGVDFDIVKCNGADCGFTTRMGINWLPWMAYRELRCNCTDELGIVSDTFDGSFDTVIEVDCPEIYKAHFDADRYFVAGTLIGESANVEIYDRPSQHVYYQGVAVYDLGKPSKYSYNIRKPIELTEDRTAKNEYEIRFAITQCMQLAEYESFLDDVLEQDESFEAAVGFDSYWPQSEKFIEQAIKKQASEKGVPDTVNKMIQAHIDRNGDWPEFELTSVQTKQLKNAVAFLCDIDVNVYEYPVKFVKGLGHGVLGRAHKGEIYISELPFNMGTKKLAAVLLEEWVHNKTGAADFDRTMQNWLFDKIMSLGEKIAGEPV